MTHILSNTGWMIAGGVTTIAAMLWTGVVLIKRALSGRN
jgi:hypothetical protein